MPVINVNGEAIHYIKEGSGPVVVLIHSLGSSSQMWLEQIAALKNRYMVVAFDTRGHGQSSAKGEISVGAVAQDLKELLKQLGVSRCDLVAISTGGPIAISFAAEHPAIVRSLVLADTYAQPVEGYAQLVEATAEAIAYVSMEEFGRQYAAETLLASTPLDTQDELAATIAKMNPKVYIQMMRSALLGDFKSRLANLTAPTLVLIGQGDVTSPRSASELLAATIPNAKLELVPEAGHLSCLDNPAAFSELIGKFLDANRETS